MKTQTIVVQGMHCDSCKALVRMELEDGGYEDNVLEVSLIEGQNKGKVVLTELSTEQLKKVKEIINEMESYSVE